MEAEAEAEEEQQQLQEEEDDLEMVVNLVEMTDVPLRVKKRSAHGHTLLGDAYLRTGKAQKAADSFKRALKIDPDNSRARNGYTEAEKLIPPPPEDEF